MFLASGHQLNWLQSVLSAEARLVCHARKYDHVSHLALRDNIRVMVIVWRLRANMIRTVLCWIVWHSVHSQQHSYMTSSYRSNRLGLSHWDPHAVRRDGCLSCIIVTWWSGSDGIQAWSRWPTCFRQCFGTVGLVIWPVKIVPEMTYNVTLMCWVGRSALHYYYLHWSTAGSGENICDWPCLFSAVVTTWRTSPVTCAGPTTRQRCKDWLQRELD